MFRKIGEIMEKLEREVVDHVADLARLYVSEEEKDKYGVQLAQILTEIDKINKVNVEDEEDMLIAPTENKNEYREDIVGEMLKKDAIFKNAKHASDGYIIVPRVIGND